MSVVMFSLQCNDTPTPLIVLCKVNRDYHFCGFVKQTYVMSSTYKICIVLERAFQSVKHKNTKIYEITLLDRYITNVSYLKSVNVLVYTHIIVH